MGRDGVFGRLRSLVDREDPEVIYECRRCGTTLDTDADACPYCETEEVDRFVI